MKIAITSKGTNLDSEVDPRFGRAKYFVVVNPETMEFEAIDNSQNANAFNGAGIQAASMVAHQGVEVVLTGFCGPNAFRTLEAAGVKVGNNVAGTVREAAAAFREGKISFAQGANAEGHW